MDRSERAEREQSYYLIFDSLFNCRDGRSKEEFKLSKWFNSKIAAFVKKLKIILIIIREIKITAMNLIN